MSTNRAKLEALLKLVNSAAQEAIAEYEKAGEDVPFIDSTGPHPLDSAADQVALKSAIRTLEGASAQLCATLAPPAHTIMTFIQGYEDACIRVALREKITDILVDYPNGIHADDLSKIINIEPKRLARLLRVLATRGCYNEVDADTFANNRLSLLLHSSHPASHLACVRAEACAQGATVLYETLKDPRTAYSEDPAHAPVMYAKNKEGITGTYFDWLKQEEPERERFHRAMQAMNDVMASGAFLTRFPFEKVSTLIDVGGGIGAFSIPLAKAHKHVKITIQDLPEALVHSRNAWARDCPEAIQESRIEFAEIDFLTQAPLKGKDIYYLRNILHDWPDHEATLILRNVCQALGPHSRLLVHDYVLLPLSRKQAEADAAANGASVAPEPLLPNYGAGGIRMYQRDLTMWVMFNAKERTLQDSLRLSTAAGLKLERIWELGETSVLEFSAA